MGAESAGVRVLVLAIGAWAVTPLLAFALFLRVLPPGLLHLLRAASEAVLAVLLDRLRFSAGWSPRHSVVKSTSGAVRGAGGRCGVTEERRNKMRKTMKKKTKKKKQNNYMYNGH